MAAQGRGSAARGNAAAVVAMVLLCVLLHGELAEGKRFRAGDVLVFKYSPKAHNVVPVSAAGYSSCSAPRGARALTSGNDRVTLKRGVNYFICSFPGHCQAGMKVAVTAA
ncbi:unnamed protein product [Urochloa decumbens]|uniref:Plantacyanin n=1 Tax=Urochloa decumbens TaxID=240449 RepID=A0ABC8XNA7_9POAL